jgi:hypothetical protein
MGRKSVTLSLEEEIYKKYKEYCQQNAIALSRSIEIFMEEQLKKTKEKR